MAMHRDRRVKLLFLLPAALWVLCFTVFPLLYGVRLSFYNVKIGKPDQFVGLANYAHFLRDSHAHNALAVTLAFAFLSRLAYVLAL